MWGCGHVRGWADPAELQQPEKNPGASLATQTAKASALALLPWGPPASVCPVGGPPPPPGPLFSLSCLAPACVKPGREVVQSGGWGARQETSAGLVQSATV